MQKPPSSQRALPGIAALWASCPHSPLGLQAFNSVASITCTIRRPIPEVFCERAGNDKPELNGLAATRKTGSRSGDLRGPTQALGHPPELALLQCVAGMRVGQELDTLISFFTFLLLGLDVLLRCCFDFLDPGSTAKSNPYGECCTTSRELIVMGDFTPTSSAIFSPTGFQRHCKSIQGLLQRFWIQSYATFPYQPK